jgi:hypothetical protein
LFAAPRANPVRETYDQAEDKESAAEQVPVEDRPFKAEPQTETVENVVYYMVQTGHENEEQKDQAEKGRGFSKFGRLQRNPRANAGKE